MFLFCYFLQHFYDSRVHSPKLCVHRLIRLPLPLRLLHSFSGGDYYCSVYLFSFLEHDVFCVDWLNFIGSCKIFTLISTNCSFFSYFCSLVPIFRLFYWCSVHFYSTLIAYQTSNMILFGQVKIHFTTMFRLWFSLTLFFLSTSSIVSYYTKYFIDSFKTFISRNETGKS